MSGGIPGASAHMRRALLAVVLIAGAIVALCARPTAIDVFFRRIDRPPAGAPGVSSSGSPDAIFAIRVDPETNATTVIDVTPPPPPPPPAHAREDTARVLPDSARDRGATPPDLDVDDLLDRAGAPRTGGSAPRAAAIPPRPVEITWPETRQLKHCIGRSVEVRILVGDDGRVKTVEAVPSAVEVDCLDAAVAAARRIKFEAGRQAGMPVEMWTQVRIDFERTR